jgi:hypothetical protein
MHFVVDENVLVVANGRDTHSGKDCILAAIDFLTSCSEDMALVLDDLGEVITLYASKCNWAGQPGVGDQFFVWAFSNSHALQQVRLTRTADGQYSAVPPGLSSFDSDDHIYLALVLEAAPPTELVNAVDSDYSQSIEAIADAGVVVRELCPEELRD